jgi:hypothetical protein
MTSKKSDLITAETLFFSWRKDILSIFFRDKSPTVGPFVEPATFPSFFTPK